jgi:hypothetical protein
VEQIRVSYDIEAACVALKEAGLPSEFAETLRTGKA